MDGIKTISFFRQNSSLHNNNLIVGCVFNTYIEDVNILRDIVKYIDTSGKFTFDARCVIGPGPGLNYAERQQFYKDVDILLIISNEKQVLLESLECNIIQFISNKYGLERHLNSEHTKSVVLEHDSYVFIKALMDLDVNNPNVSRYRHNPKNIKDDLTDHLDYLDWCRKPKKDGISFMVRANNEEATIGNCLESLRSLTCQYEINVILHNCTDKTEEICIDKRNSGLPVNIYHLTRLLSRAGIENVVTPLNSKYSAIRFINWCMTKSNMNYTFRWDADFILSPELSKELSAIKFHQCWNYRICAVNEEINNCEKYLFCNAFFPRFYRHMFWEQLEHSSEKSVPENRLLGQIFHDSLLANKKTYWDKQVWWNAYNDPDVQLYEERFNQIVDILGSDQLAVCRSSDESLDYKNLYVLFSEAPIVRNNPIPYHTKNTMAKTEKEAFFTQFNEPVISVILMSRKRPEQLNALLDNLEKTCNSILNFEVLIKMDTDDDTIEQVRTNRTFRCKIIVSDRKNGYLSAADHLNEAARYASGSYIWTLNDDLVCETNNWDTIIIDKMKEFPDEIVCLFPDHSTHGNNCFPVITKKWYDIVGHITLSGWPHTDSWISTVAKKINREVPVQIYLEHKIIGGPTDEIYREGTFNESNSKLGNTFEFKDNDPRQGDIEKLKQFIVV